MAIPVEAQPTSMSDEDRLIDFLRDRDVACPQCEYNLRGLTSPRCPECGQAVQLSVTLVDPYLKAWIALLVALCAGAGIGFLFLIALITDKGSGPPSWMLAPILVFIAMMPAVLIIVLSRRRFMRFSRRTQWSLAVAGIGVFLSAIGLFVYEALIH